jgi:hypothetical protein
MKTPCRDSHGVYLRTYVRMYVCTQVRTYARQSSILQSLTASFENSVQAASYWRPIFVDLAPSLLFTRMLRNYEVLR